MFARNMLALSSTLRMETPDSTETLALFYQTTRSDIPENSNLHIRCLGSLKSHSRTLISNTGRDRNSTAVNVFIKLS
jgi:hypothetical protein